MPKFFSFVLVIFLSIQMLSAQTVQWASEVIAFSTESKQYGSTAHQALGVPNALMSEELTHMAWAPKKEESTVGEYLHVGFKTPMKIQQVAIAESLNPGAIYRIWAFDTDGKRHQIFARTEKAKTMDRSRIFRYKFDLTAFLVKELKLELNTKSVPGMNQIDAIAISDSDEDIKSSVSLLRYAEEVEKPENLGPTVNSNYAERLPIISPDGQTLFFARKKHPKNMGEAHKDDIWISRRQADDTWSKAVNAGKPLNTDDHNFVVATNPSGTQLFLGNDYKKQKEGVSFARTQGESWSEPISLNIEGHYNDSEFVSYHFNIDANILLMSVERKEGLGDRDFYVSFKKGNGVWTKPINLGETINTVNTENSVFIAADNKTIYFSSNGHPGYGGFDMFMSRRLDNSWTKWTKPKNLGRYINTKQDDLNYTVPASGEYAYFSSGTLENSDLYRIKLPKEIQPKPVALVKTQLVDGKGQPIAGQLNIERIGKAGKKSRKTPESQHDLILPFGDNVSIYAEKDGYFSSSASVSLSDTEIEELDGTAPPPAPKEDEIVADETGVKKSKKVIRLEKELRNLKKEIAESEKKPRPTSPRPTKKHRDPEVDYLKAKFDKLVGTGSSKKPATKPATKPSTKPANKPTTIPSKDELAAMKERFNDYFKKDKDEPKEEQEEEVEETEVVTSTPNESDSSDTDSGFEAYKAALRAALVHESTPMIKARLQSRAFIAVKRELDEPLSIEQEDKVLERLEQQVVTPTACPDVYADLPPSVRRDLDKEMRSKLGPKVEKELRVDLKPIVEAEIRKEITYVLNKEKEAALEEAIVAAQEESTAAAENADEEAAAEANLPVEAEETATGKPSYKEVTKEIVLVPIEVGQIIPMNNIFFDANKATLKDESFGELDRILAFLKANDRLIVEVGGHTNDWCSSEFAHELSTNRSKLVMNYLRSKGVASIRIKHKGYGKTRPVASNKTKAGRRKNQRVELKILEVM